MKLALIVAALVVVLVAGSITGYFLLSAHHGSVSPNPASRQIVLPFTGLHDPAGVAVDSAGNLYVADDQNDRALKLAAGAATQTMLLFTGLDRPNWVAVDSVGNLYVVDSGNNRLLNLPAGSDTPTALPFTGLKDPNGVAVDTAGNLYLVD